MYHYNTEKFTLVQCQETNELYAIRSVYNPVFESANKDILFPCHKFNEEGDVAETPTIFKSRNILSFAPWAKNS